ncbi:hypothetical protein FEM03_16115 [Phragmitibacter flavus]|uniref:Uncharacterized protein n=1 Tax=Phragmitibacter flavus TaxID=2576071 RepID=A0A5R8KC08_9BACT|nr:hypothetical protein [Phragmitibacter flavus]TLD69844.1 hypothetical protein FEM03_16115 [Phragmitibacter flavus]
MSANKRIRKPSTAKTAKDLLALDMPSTVRKPKVLKDKAELLKDEVHRLEVAIAATSKVFSEQRRRRNDDELPPPERSAPKRRGEQRLTLAQASEKRRVFYMQVLEFTVTALLFVGACAWLYQWWLSRSAN